METLRNIAVGLVAVACLAACFVGWLVLFALGERVHIDIKKL